MKQFLKSLGLAILILLIFVFVYNLLYGSKDANSQNQKYIEKTEKYWENVEKQTKAYSDQLEEGKKQLLTAKMINEMGVENQKRFSRLLERWEKQADRIDVILSKYE